MIKKMMDGSICFVAGKKMPKSSNSNAQSSSYETLECERSFFHLDSPREETKVIPDEPVKIYKIRAGRKKNHHPPKLKEIPVLSSSAVETNSKIIMSCPVCPYTTSCSNRFEKHLDLHPSANTKSSCEMDWEQLTDVKSSFQMPLQTNENVTRDFSNSGNCLELEEKSDDLSKSLLSNLNSATKSISLSEFLDTPKENVEPRKKSKGRGVIKNKSIPSKQLEGENCDFEASSLPNLTVSPLSPSPYRCSFCNYATSRKAHFRSHSLSHRGDSYICRKCSFSTNTKEKLVEHMYIHLRRRAYTCPDCRFLTLSREDYKEHMKVCCSRFFECFYCDYISVRKDHMKRHLRTHSKVVDMDSIKPTINDRRKIKKTESYS